jgi:hypothetical protein
MGEAPKLVSPARVFARPTADQIWLGPSQRAALSQLSRPAQVRLIVGPGSCGKTTLAYYHLLVLLVDLDISLSDIELELEHRHNPQGSACEE